jgi:type II secretory pathway component PulK
MALSDRIDETLAERLISSRDRSPFKTVDDVGDIPGFRDILSDIKGKYTVKGAYFRIKSEASLREIRRTAEAVIELKGTPKVLYFRES